MTITGNFEFFQYFNFETSFLKNENLFKKMENRFLAESDRTENATFSYKTALTEANVKTNRMGRIQNEPITKSRVLPVTT